MQDRKFDYATIGVANTNTNTMDVSGRATADERGLRARNANITLARIARYSLLGVAIALLPLRQALAYADDNNAQIIPVQSSTVPSNGDQNPYGVAFVPADFRQGGALHPGDILVSNFNNAGSPPTGNLQGTGTTIVKVAPNGNFIGEFSIDSANGAAFGIAIAPSGEDSVRFAAVDDSRNDLTVFRLSTP